MSIQLLVKSLLMCLRPKSEEEMHHEEVPMAAAAINTSTIHLDGGTCESEQLSQVIKSTIMVSTYRSDPYVKLQGLGKQCSSDPSPYSHKAVLEAARIAALAATAASAALADMRRPSPCTAPSSYGCK